MKMKLFLSTQEEDPLGNQNEKKKHRLEEEKLKKEDSQILLSTVCTRSYLSIMVEPRMQPIMITLDAKEYNFTLEAGKSHSPMMIES